MPPEDRIETRGLICPHCKKATAAKVKGTAVYHGYDEHGQQVDPPMEYALIQCQRCGLASVQTRDDYGGGFELYEPTIVYPAPRRLSYTIPEPLRREWEEAQACFDAKAFTACVVMVRRTLEGTCREQGVQERTLARSLKELRNRGLIDDTLAEWADALRVVGNEGAHYTGRGVGREDAEDALSFTEALLDNLYVLRKRFSDFQARIAARTVDKSSPQTVPKHK
jgi:DNA-directed RNA polymerase subunit RPC12/RpoP